MGGVEVQLTSDQKDRERRRLVFCPLSMSRVHLLRVERAA